MWSESCDLLNEACSNRDPYKFYPDLLLIKKGQAQKSKSFFERIKECIKKKLSFL